MYSVMPIPREKQPLRTSEKSWPKYSFTELVERRANTIQDTMSAHRCYPSIEGAVEISSVTKI